MKKNDPLVTVIMPVYRQENFLPRALVSLRKQIYQHWELIIVNDGGNSDLFDAAHPDPRITHLINETNQGLGYSINRALDIAKGDLIAYLPADDLICPDHLSTLLETLQVNSDAVLAFSSMKHHYNKVSEGILGDYLQLVQVMHRKNNIRWTERSELESDHLGRLFWDKLHGDKVHTGQLTCDWTDHPLQRHKIMQEPTGGINRFRQYYAINSPLRFHSTKGHFMDEQSRYETFRNKSYRPSGEGLRILIVGELAYNPERVLALAEKGHMLFGLWMKDPYWYNYVGPLPFGHVQDIDPDRMEEQVRNILPDLIYGCLNWQAVPFVLDVVKRFPDIPFCWHFKEGPFICLEKGSWNDLLELYKIADGRIYSSKEMMDWFNEFLPSPSNPDLVLDGDLPKKDWFSDTRSALIPRKRGEIHTVVPGRPIGLHPGDVAELAKQDIHLHFYGEFTQGQWEGWIRKTKQMAPEHLHIHPNVDQEKWVEEFSQYDAGWLHFFKSQNYGNITKANWDDLNIPARVATLALAGLPMIQANNEEHIVATQSLVKQMNGGFFVSQLNELRMYLSDQELITSVRENVWSQRKEFFFDTHVDKLIRYFRAVISTQRSKYISPPGMLQR